MKVITSVMSAAEILVLQVGAKLIGVIFAACAAVLAFLEILKEEKGENVRQWFRRRWDIINECAWIRLPEISLRAFLNAERFFTAHVIRLYTIKWLGSCVVLQVALSLVMIVLLSINVCANAILASCLFVAYILLHNTVPSQYSILRIISNFVKCLALILWMLPIASYIFTTDLIMAALFMTLSFPLYGAVIVLLLRYVTDTWLVVASRTYRNAIMPNQYLHNMDNVGKIRSWKGDLFAIAMAISSAVTLVCLVLGRICDINAWVPQTPQMLLSNVICDGLTVMATIYVLTIALRGNILVRVPIAIMLDIMIGGFLACASLYFGVVGTQHDVHVDEVLNILLGRSIDGSVWNLGPYFWAMHTVFLPTICFLSFIMVTWAAKCLLIPVHHFFGAASHSKRPLALSAALAGIGSAIFGGVGLTLEQILKLV